jgi:LPXTG-motif cell wall-anchored protein
VVVAASRLSRWIPFAAMSRRLALLALLVLCAGFVPAAIATAPAAAQSAGDEQYEDPFGGGNGGGGGGSAQPQPTPAQPATPQPASTPVPAGASAGATASSGSAGAAQSDGLPRTGAPVDLIALAGVLLLAGGLALRRHVRAGA